MATSDLHSDLRNPAIYSTKNIIGASSNKINGIPIPSTYK